MRLHTRRSLSPVPFVMGAILGLAVVAGIYHYSPGFTLPIMAEPTATPLPSPTPLRAKPHLDEALRLESEGRLEEAISEYQQAASAEPDLPDSYIGLAKILTFRRQPGEAVAKARRATELAPGRADGYAVLAVASDWNEQPDQAIIYARRAIELDPKLAEAHAYLAEAYADKQRLGDASDSLQRALALDPNSLQAVRVKGYLAEMQAHYPEAARVYSRALELAPRQPYLYLLLGNALRAAGDFDGAIIKYQQAAELDPKDPRGPYWIGYSYATRENYKEAEEPLKAALAIDQNYASALGQLGLVYYAEQRHTDAIPYLMRATELEKPGPKLATYRHVLGWSLYAEKRYTEAREQFAKALELDPKLQGAKDGLEMVAKAEKEGTGR